MSKAVRFRNFKKKTTSKVFYSYALLVLSIFSMILSGCSGFVTANSNGAPPGTLTVTNVTASTPTTSGFQVKWATNIAANSAVDYGTSTSYGTTTPVNTSMVTSHQESLAGLTKGTLYHFRVRSTDAKGANAASPDMTFATTGDVTPPTVSIVAPAANATLSGTTTVTADASDNVAVANVQVKVDNANTGAPITASPYSYSLNTTTLSNGNHVLTAVATDTSGNATTSAGVAVKVSNNAAAVPSITSLNPTSGVVGSSVTVTGTNFGTTQGTSTVKFNGTAGTPTSWSATSIVVPVPAGATTGNVVVTVGGTASNGVSFTVTVPTPSITSLNPTSGLVGTSVTITGANFGATQGTNTVKFNGTTAAATSWSATSIVAKAPAGASTGNVVVTISGVASNGVSFTVQADTTAPTVPSGLSATAVSSSQINLSWTASTDNVGVTGYNVYRGGTKIGTSPNTTYQDVGLTASTSYSYNVSAFDAAGNTSAQSAGASATTQAAGSGGGIPSALGWYQIPNTPGPACPSGFTGCNNVVAAWSGAVADTTRNRLILWGGGHTDYNGNELYALDLNTLTFARLNNPSAPAGSCVAANSDGTPNARHTYDGLAYLPSTDQMFAFNGSLSCGAGSGPNPSDSWTYSFSTGTWQRISYTGNAPGTSAGTHYDYLTFGDDADYDPNTGLVIAKDGAGIFTYNPSTKVWTPVNSFGSDYHLTSVVDPKRKLFISMGNGQGFKVNIASGSGYPATTPTFSGCGSALSQASPGLAYDPVQNLIVGWGGGGTVYLYNPDTDSCTSVTYPNGPGAEQQNGTFGRFRYFPALGVFALVNDWGTNAYTLRLTPASGGGSGPNISGISVNSITTVSANVIWTTDVPATTQVEYGITAAYGNLTTLNATLSTSHSQALAGLTIGTLYHYRVHSKNSGGVESISGDAVFSTNSTVDTTPPTVSMTAPASGATVSNTVTVSATAADNVAVASVQFTLDGANLGAAVTAAPYQISWDSTKAANGAHSLSAVATDTSANKATASAVSVTVSNSGVTALQDFQSRCGTSGVIVCEGFDDPAEFVPSTGPQATNSGLYSNAGPTTISVVQDTSIVSSGAGSLKFPIAANDGNNPNTVRQDNWVQLFCGAHPPASCTRQVFGPHTTFYVQFRYRVDSNYVNTDWEANQNGGSSPKIADIASFNSSCGQTELTTNNRGATGRPMMYTNCGSGNYGGIYALPGTTNAAQTSPPYAWQSSGAGSPGYECDYPSTPGGLGCFTMPADTWMTFYYKIALGTGNQVFDSQIKAWIGPDGQALQPFIDVTNFPLAFDTPGYDAIFFNVYMTGFLKTATNPAANAWLDEVIVSTSPIPAPAVNGGGIPQ
jgi:hypothetical protein